MTGKTDQWLQLPEIAKMFGLSEESIKRLAKTQGFPLRRLTPYATPGVLESELVSAAKGTVGLVISSYEIAIAPGRCAIACVKLGTHLERSRDPHVSRQDRIQCTSHSHGIPALGEAHTDRLTSRVHGGVSSS